MFYPARRPRGFDELRYYAEHFDIVEVNSTFYRMPDRGLAAKWVERTPADFQFAIKLFQKFTHPDMFLASAGVKDWTVSLGDVDAFREGIAPIVDAGKFAALLVQFPTSFHADIATREYLSWVLEMFARLPIAVELRHESWFKPGEETTKRLAAGGATLVLADSPENELVADCRQNDRLRSNPLQSATSSFWYLRLHGRNFANWWQHEQSEDRYNYLYSPAELAPFAAAAAEASEAGRKVMAFMNNHFSAKAAANAAILRSQLGQTVPGLYEREMVNRYPDLEGIVTTSGLPL